MKRSWLLSAIVSALIVAACSGGGAPDRLSIAVIPKGTSHAFWQSIHAGARKAASELTNVDIAWRGPLREDDRDAQVAEIENAVGRGASGIVLAPLDDAAMVAPVSAAMRQTHSSRDHRLGPEGRRLRQLCRDRQRGRRPARRRETGRTARRTRPCRPAAIRRGQRQHDQARGRLPDGDGRQPWYGSGELDRLLPGADVEGAYKKSEAILSQHKKGRWQPGHRRHLLFRTKAARSACCASSRTTGGPAR